MVNLPHQGDEPTEHSGIGAKNNMYTEQAFIDEVESLHIFLEAWLKGEAERTDPGLKPLDDALSDDFVVVHPTGSTDDKAGALANFGNAHGVRAEDYQLIVDNIEPRLIGHSVGLVTYRESHRGAGQSGRDRLATAVLSMNRDSGKITWLHLHETLLPEG